MSIIIHLRPLSKLWGSLQYDTALSYLQHALRIRQEIGDGSGLSSTLFNIGLVHLQREEVNEALSAWVTVYRLAKQLGLTRPLQSLEALAPKLGLQGGLVAWDELSKQAESTFDEADNKS